MKNLNLIYTPSGLPIGEPIIKEDGSYGLLIKRDGNSDIITLEYVISEFIDIINRRK